jgi:hypothetical protein
MQISLLLLCNLSLGTIGIVQSNAARLNRETTGVDQMCHEFLVRTGSEEYANLCITLYRGLQAKQRSFPYDYQAR